MKLPHLLHQQLWLFLIFKKKLWISFFLSFSIFLLCIIIQNCRFHSILDTQNLMQDKSFRDNKLFGVHDLYVTKMLTSASDYSFKEINGKFL